MEKKLRICLKMLTNTKLWCKIKYKRGDSMSTTSIFHERLKFLREKNGYTQSELAEILHISNSSVCNYEAGKNSPSIEMLIRVAEIFDVSIDYLIGYSNLKYPTSKLKVKFSSNTNVDELIEMLLSLDKEHRADALKQIKYISTHNNLKKDQSLK